MRNLKKVIALVAVFAMLVSTVVFADTYTDVASTDNYAEAIETLSALGIITGDDQDGDGNAEFRPNDTITRAEVTALVCRIQGLGNVSQAPTSFTDVPSSHWASGYIAQVAGQGYVNGIGNGLFDPESPIKYEEAAKILMEVLGYRPFVNDNGGYPTGYIAAAQRYGVLDGVVGGGVGAEAPRGMVAQMVYNAIDTPVMDRYTYGADAQYVIYNGETYYFETLMTRDLNLVKTSGKMVANSYTDTRSAGGATVDTGSDATVQLLLDNTAETRNYFPEIDREDLASEDGYVQEFYQGDVEADEYLGYAVSVIAREERNGNYTLVSLVPNASKNNEVSFTLDQFDRFEDDDTRPTLYYRKNASDRNSSALRIEKSNLTVIYNGVAGASQKLSDYFGEGKMIEKDTRYSGRVTLLDISSAAGYDVVRIEIGVGAVVNEVTSRNRVEFKNEITVPTLSTGSSTSAKEKTLKYLNCDPDEDGVKVSITKDGQPYDYQDLQEWDVVTIIWNGEENANSGVFNVRVLGEDQSILSSITAERIVSGSGKDAVYEYSIDGTWYQSVTQPYGASSLSPGTSGRFYIDEYGKIVALDTSEQPDNVAGVPTDNYAYVINATETGDEWGEPTVRLQVLAKDGNVYEPKLASSVRYINAPEDVLKNALGITANSDGTYDESYTVSAKKVTSSEYLADSLVNTMITYASNSAGDIRTIAFPADSNSDTSYLKYASGSNAGGIINKTSVEFDEDNMTLGSYELSDDTLVFYISGDSTLRYQGTATADTNDVSVGLGSEMVEADYDAWDVIPFDEDNNGVVRAVVLMNADSSTSPSSNVAVINSVGEASAPDGSGDTVYLVTYWMDGEYQSATTKVDMKNAEDLEVARRGEVWKFNVSGDTILNASEVMGFDSTTDLLYIKDPKAEPDVTLAATRTNSDEDYYFGAVTNVSRNTGARTLALYNSSTKAFDKNNTMTVRTANNGRTNVYVYDPSLRNDNRLVDGTLSDATLLDTDLVDPELKSVTIEGTTVDVPAFGALDYMFVRYYNNAAADIVIYKNWEFDY